MLVDRLDFRQIRQKRLVIKVITSGFSWKTFSSNSMQNCTPLPSPLTREGVKRVKTTITSTLHECLNRGAKQSADRYKWVEGRLTDPL